jgi:thiosulfate reductase cytochrome b subunit
MQEKIYLTPTPVRIWHWLNAFGIITLILTGAEIRFPEYVQILGNYKAAVRLHNTAGVVVALSFALWLIYYGFVARNLLRLYIPSKEDIKRGMISQATFYCYQYFRGGPNPHQQTPEDKFNALQKTAYAAMMLVFTPLVILTGVLLMNVAPLRNMVTAVGGLKLLIAAHWLLACIFCSFVFAHLYLATLGHTPFAHFKPMWTGWEEVMDESHGKE